jgi:predicted metal-dependent hydrolase
MLVTSELHTQASSNGRVLHSWKEIATYMGRGVRTIQRYEARLGLPVRRPSGAPRSAVLAFTNEIDQWLAQSPTRVESSQPPRESKRASGHNHIFVQSLYDKAVLSHQRADAMQKRMEAMQTLVAQLTVRMQTGMERRKKMRTLAKENKYAITETLDRFQTFLTPPGSAQS